MKKIFGCLFLMLGLLFSADPAHAENWCLVQCAGGGITCLNQDTTPFTDACPKGENAKIQCGLPRGCNIARAVPNPQSQSSMPAPKAGSGTGH